MSAFFGDDVVASMAYVMLVASAVTAIMLSRLAAPYGRHSGEGSWLPLNDVRINPRLGWFLQEVPSLLLPIMVFWNHSSSTVSHVNVLLMMLYVIHYIHRAIIYPFLMPSGNKEGLLIVISALMFCTFNGYMQSKYLIMAKYSDDWTYGWRSILGSLLFFLGMFINIHSDHILRSLRKPGEKGYKIPRGGMFTYISGANYFGEIIEWLGFAIACWSLPSFAFAVFTISNIAPRSFHHHRWYHSKFTDYPKDRKALIPFIL